MTTDLNSSNVGTTLHPEPHGSPATLGNPASLEGLLVWLSPRSSESFALTLSHLNQTFEGQDPGQGVFVATPGYDAAAIAADSFPNLQTLPVPASSLSIANRFITAADYVYAFQAMQDHGAKACLILGAESDSLSPASLLKLGVAVLAGNVDLAVPYYQIGSHQGLVNSAILYPLTRTLFGAFPRFPLSVDLGLSYRMAERLALRARPALASLGSEDAIVWPVTEAAINNFTIVEVPTGLYSSPQPPPTDLNALLAVVLGSLFSDIDAKATYWQRVRPLQPAKAVPAAIASTVPWPDVQPMLDAFRLAYTNLSGIWSLVLPPNSLVGLKHLSLMPAERFHMSDALWVRIVYDFILAYRQRTLNRGHLLGALTPLYLAWVASHIRLSDSGEPPEKHIQNLAAAFENDKAYLVSRWRWPDRFNP